MTSLALLSVDYTPTDADNDPASELVLPAEQQARLDKARVVADGLTKLRAGGKIYLPKLEGESDARYAVRVQLGALNPALELMLESAAGKVLETEITFESDMPDEGVALAENVDGRGTGIVQYSREILRFGLVDGIAGTFVDMPRIDGTILDRRNVSAAAGVQGAALDHADGTALGLRPYLVQVKAGDYKATYTKVGGQQVLTRFILRELVHVPVGRFGSRAVTQYRVYERTGTTVTCELWRVPPSQQRAVLVPGSATTLTNCDRICWAPLQLGPMLRDGYVKPAFEPLIDLILQYYQVQNGMMSLSFEAFVATIVRMGAQAVEVTNPDGTVTLVFPVLLTGAGEVIESPAAGENGAPLPPQPIYYLQPNSDVLVPADAMLTRIQAQIDRICGALYGTDVAGESGEAKKQKARGGNAWVGNVARAYKEMLELSWQHAMAFLGLQAGGINVKTSFEDVTLNAQEITAIAALVDAGLAVKDAVQVLILRGFFGPHADADDIATAWEDNRSAAADQKAADAELKADAMRSNNATPEELAA